MAKEKKEKVADEGDPLFILVYLVPVFSGVLIYFVKQGDERFGFHAIQSILLGIVIYILLIVPVIGDIASLLLWLYGLYIGIEAYHEDDDIGLPYIGEFASEYSKRKAGK